MRGIEPPTRCLSLALLGTTPAVNPETIINNGADERNRTPDPLFTRQPLYQLSYIGTKELPRIEGAKQPLYQLSYIGTNHQDFRIGLSKLPVKSLGGSAILRGGFSSAVLCGGSYASITSLSLPKDA